MLSCDEVINLYWNQYISIEKEFAETVNYVALAEDNYRTYSDAYIKIMLQLGSEVDIALKLYCQTLDKQFSGENIDKYRDLIQKYRPEFCDQIVQVTSNNIEIQPWNNWNKLPSAINPYWWKAYNKIKHDRTNVGTIGSETKNYYKFANLQYVLQGLAGLYQTLIYLYYDMARLEDKSILTPLPGSRTFRLIGDQWNNINFYGDYAFYINKDGHLIMEYGKPYF